MSSKLDQGTSDQCSTCTKISIDGKEKCLIYAGQTEANQAEKLCQTKKGEVPVPKNEQENTDYYNAFTTLSKTVKCAIIGKVFL